MKTDETIIEFEFDCKVRKPPEKTAADCGKQLRYRKPFRSFGSGYEKHIFA